MNVLSRIVKIAGQALHIQTITLPFNPVPASRPRVTRWGVFYGKTYMAWRKLAEAHLVKGNLDLTCPLLVVVESVRQNPKTKSKKTHPRGDVDNYAKAPLDSIGKADGYWYDDDQIVYLLTCKRWARRDEDPHQTVEIYTVADEDTRP